MSLIDGARLGYQQTKLENVNGASDLAGAVPEDRAAIAKLAEEFESIFTEIVLKSMRETVPDKGLIDGGNGEDVFRSMLDSEYAKSMAVQRRSGIADALERQLLAQADQQAQNTRTAEGKRAYGIQPR